MIRYTVHLWIFSRSTWGGVLEKGLPLFIRTSYGEWCISNRHFWPPDGFTMAAMSKVCRHGWNRLAIKNNKHAPNRNLKAYLIKDDILKLTGWHSSWVTSYLLLSITNTTTSWPNRRVNRNRFTINSYNNLLCHRKNSLCHAAERDKEAGRGGGQ